MNKEALADALMPYFPAHAEAVRTGDLDAAQLAIGIIEYTLARITVTEDVSYLRWVLSEIKSFYRLNKYGSLQP